LCDVFSFTLVVRLPPSSTLFPYTTLFRSLGQVQVLVNCSSAGMADYGPASPVPEGLLHPGLTVMDIVYKPIRTELLRAAARVGADRKSTRLNSSHVKISYAVFCLKKKTNS